MPAGFKIEGLGEVLKNLASLATFANRLDQQLAIAIEETILPGIRAQTRVRTGRTRRNWRVRHIRRFEYEVSNETPYAAFIRGRGDTQRFGPVAIDYIRREFPNAVQVALARTQLL